MTATATSREAHAKLKTIGQLGKTERQVYEQIKYMASQAKDEKSLPNRRDIADYLGMETSSVAGRVKALIDYGLVAEIKSMKLDTRTGMTVGVLHTVDPNDRKLVEIHAGKPQYGDAVRWLDECYA